MESIEEIEAIILSSDVLLQHSLNSGGNPRDLAHTIYRIQEPYSNFIEFVKKLPSSRYARAVKRKNKPRQRLHNGRLPKLRRK